MKFETKDQGFFFRDMHLKMLSAILLRSESVKHLKCPQFVPNCLQTSSSRKKIHVHKIILKPFSTCYDKLGFWRISQPLEAKNYHTIIPTLSSLASLRGTSSNNQVGIMTTVDLKLFSSDLNLRYSCRLSRPLSKSRRWRPSTRSTRS